MTQTAVNVRQDEAGATHRDAVEIYLKTAESNELLTSIRYWVRLLAIVWLTLVVLGGIGSAVAWNSYRHDVCEQREASVFDDC